MQEEFLEQERVTKTALNSLLDCDVSWGKVSEEQSRQDFTLQVGILQQHLQIGVQLLAPLLHKVWRGIVHEQPLWRQFQPVSCHLLHRRKQ